MNYYNEIKNELINNEINRRVKSYSINKSVLNTYYNFMSRYKMPTMSAKLYRRYICKMN